MERLLKNFRSDSYGYIIKPNHVEIQADGRVNSAKSIFLTNKTLKNLPVQFNNVMGEFDVSTSTLTTLEGSPQTCDSFRCYGTPLHSLQGGPQAVSVEYNCNRCWLKTLEGAPHDMGFQGRFHASGNMLENLVGAPQQVDFLDVTSNPLNSLEGLPKYCRKLSLPYQPHIPLLRVLLVSGLQTLEVLLEEGSWSEDQTDLQEILLKYAGKGWAAMVPCAREMIRMGYRENARL